MIFVFVVCLLGVCVFIMIWGVGLRICEFCFAMVGWCCLHLVWCFGGGLLFGCWCFVF